MNGWFSRIGSSLAIVVAMSLGGSSAWAQSARVEFEIVTERGISPDTGRQWLEALRSLNVEGLRIRQARGGDAPMIRTTGEGASATHRVTGYIFSDNKLRLPGGTFNVGDTAGISRWLRKVREGGGEAGLTAKPQAFGLDEKQLVAVHEGLAAKVHATTKGKSPRDVLDEVGRGLPFRINVDGAASGAIASGEPVHDELQGLSSGTVLAAVLRPLGLVLVPVKAGGSVELRVADSQRVEEHWPVGWPAKKSAKDILPDLYKFLNVEVKDTPVAETLAAISGRLKVPTIVDQNSLARQKIDLQTTKVTLPKMNTFYSKILERLLFQAKLKYELRLDEADQPFLWITTLKQ